MIYLVHFQTPYKHAAHYLGFTERSLTQRFKRHLAAAPNRRGSALMRAIFESRIDFKVVTLWPKGDRTLERRMHDSRHLDYHCPICKLGVDYDAAECFLRSEGFELPY